MDKQQQALMEAFPDLKNLQFPLSDEKLAEILEEIKKREDLPRPPRVDPPAFGPSTPALKRHKDIQTFIEGFQYNYTGDNFFNVKGVRQNQSLFRVIEVAKRVIKESLPIKCVEAVYLGIYLSQSMHDIERLPIIFNSEIDGHRYGHIVLLVRYQGKIGAIGLSRRVDLMYKQWGFETLADVILEYKKSYEKWSHKLNKIKIGTTIPHEGSNRVSQVVNWAHTVINCKDQAWEDTAEELHKRGRGLGWESRVVKAPVIKARKAEGSKEADASKAGEGSEKEGAGGVVEKQKGGSGKKEGGGEAGGDAEDEEEGGTSKAGGGEGEGGEVMADDEPARPTFLGV